MKYMLIMRATHETIAECEKVDFDQILETMGKFNEEMISAGALVAAEGTHTDAVEGVVVDYSSKPPVVTDGPYGETKELFSGFWILDVASKEEAWSSATGLRGELLTQLGRADEARSELSRALDLCGNARERTVLERKLREIG